jgi:two-component system sensor histidine kinase KdpD
MVPMDAVLIRQVLVNLLENALRHAPGDSPLEIEALPGAGVVTVEVRDRGPGIGSDDAEHLFDRFERGSAADRRDGGVGLGLTICREIVRAHGGRISIENREGGGALVRFILPLEQEPARS